MIGARVFEHEFFAMWVIDNIEFKEYLVYNMIYGYFIFDGRTYGRLDNELGCPRVYAICYYFKLEVAYYQYLV